jgi:hypothetical protein
MDVLEEQFVLERLLRIKNDKEENTFGILKPILFFLFFLNFIHSVNSNP